MKCSVGVGICAALVLVASALTLVAAGGMAFVFLGPMSSQFFDPATLPPGADVRMMKTIGLTSAAMTGAWGALGVATGIGLIRLWKWARYSAIALGVIAILLSAMTGIAMLFVPLPPPSSSTGGEIPAGFRLFLAGFYFAFTAVAGVFVYVLARKSTAAQFNGGAVEQRPRVRPLSVSIIAWLMIVSGALTLPMMVWATLPAVFLGFVISGVGAKVFYLVYMLTYVALGVGLLRRTRLTLGPAIAFHTLAMLNALTMVLPSVWERYQAAIRSATSFVANQPQSRWGQLTGVIFGVLYAAVILFFLVRARAKLPAAEAPQPG